MKSFEIRLSATIAMGPSGPELIAPEETVIVIAQVAGIAGDYLILKDKANSPVFIADSNTVKYCRVLESIKAFKITAVESISISGGGNE